MGASTVIDRAWLKRPKSHAERPRSHRAQIAITVAAVALAAMGVWGLLADRSTGPTVGTEVSHDGGRFVVVEAWTIDDPMMGMMSGEGGNSSQFAQSGMSMGQMSQMMSDAVPEGMKRVAVQLTLRAGASTMTFPAEAVRLDVGGTTYVPYTSLLADEVLQPGDQLDGIVTFEVPMDASSAEFRLGPSTPVVTVDVSRGPGGRSPMVHDHDD